MDQIAALVLELFESNYPTFHSNGSIFHLDGGNRLGRARERESLPGSQFSITSVIYGDSCEC